MTLLGTHFVPGRSVVHWQSGIDTPLATVCASATRATATVPGSLLLTAGTFTLTVVTPNPGGAVSAPVTFTVGTPQIATTLKLSRTPGGPVVWNSDCR